MLDVIINIQSIHPGMQTPISSIGDSRPSLSSARCLIRLILLSDCTFPLPAGMMVH